MSKFLQKRKFNQMKEGDKKQPNNQEIKVINEQKLPSDPNKKQKLEI